jgi:hypothetical protein
MKKKSSAGARAKAARRSPKKLATRAAAAEGDDPDQNPDIPIKGMKVANNADGSFTVRTRAHTVTLRPPGVAPVISVRHGGAVAVGIVAGNQFPAGTIPVRSHAELPGQLKAALSRAGTGGIKDLHFSLKGRQNVDVGKLSTIMKGASSSITAHIHLAADDDDPPIPIHG